ncbi:hypothetical protein C8A03DRAFT_11815 [Achaetomium macrosporum]|uniref:Uncharacterized protein n=1 Tax=Achaetomium macrosporum TaxID=79813 RepID=A0AAN7HEC1_9PEZI|nr:hypothetical protein C8A03DRAFT_11815 [Achaetomium macrosporum]
MATQEHKGIIDVPVELILHICSFINPTYAKAPRCGRDIRSWCAAQVHLSRLGRTCRLLHGIVQPIVYHFFADATRRPVHRLLCLARTLISRPDLARHMKHIIQLNPLDDELDDVDRKFVQDAIVELGLPVIPDHWRINGEGEHRLLPLELVLAHTPNLESLRLRLGYGWHLYIIPQLLKTRPAFLTNLKSISIPGDQFELSINAIDALTRAAPNLLTLRMCSPSYVPAELFLPSLSHLRQLQFIGENSVKPWLLACMLDAAPNLEMLALYWDLSDEDFYAYDLVNEPKGGDLWDAIELRKNSLRELRFGLSDEATNNRHAQEDSFLSNMFPPTIREVTIWDDEGDEGWVRPAMQRFASDVAVGRYPNLEVVNVGLYRDGRDAAAWEDVKNELKEKFARGGVEFEMIWTDDFGRSILGPDLLTDESESPLESGGDPESEPGDDTPMMPDGEITLEEGSSVLEMLLARHNTWKRDMATRDS